MAEKDTQIRQIASQLQPKFAAYLRDSSKREGLTAAERRVLDAVRSNPLPGQLQSLYNMTKFSNTNVLVRERAFGSLATALGMEPPQARSLWQRLSGGTPTADLPGPAQVTTGRVPGEGSRRGGQLTGVGEQTVQRSKYLEPILQYMDEGFRNWYTSNDLSGMTAAERNAASRALADPNNPDLQALAQFSTLSPERFLDIAEPIVVPMIREDQVAREKIVETGAEVTARRNPYYDPSQSRVVFLTVAEAGQRGLRPATPAQVRREDEKAASGVQPPVGFEWGYDPVQSKPVLVPKGSQMPARVPGSPGRMGGMGDGDGTGGGGGGVPGAVPGVVPETGMVDTGVPPDWESAAAEMYPEYYAIVKNNPEIADLLRRSLGPPAWSEAKFEAELRKTNWYKTTTASAREWDTKSALDPATYQAMVDEQATNISTQALNFGIRLSDETAQKLALDSLRLGWGEQTIINSIGMAATASGTPGATQLREGYYGQSVRQIAKRYGVTLADETFNSFVNRIAVGDETMDSFQDYALNIAKALYPSVAAQFDAGRTFEDVIAPFQQIAASTLEISPDAIDFTDPKWVTPITYQPDPNTGEQRLMTLTEWTKELRTNRAYGYEFTNQARNQAYSVVETLGNLFGRI